MSAGEGKVPRFLWAQEGCLGWEACSSSFFDPQPDGLPLRQRRSHRPIRRTRSAVLFGRRQSPARQFFLARRHARMASLAGIGASPASRASDSCPHTSSLQVRGVARCRASRAECCFGCGQGTCPQTHQAGHSPKKSFCSTRSESSAEPRSRRCRRKAGCCSSRHRGEKNLPSSQSHRPGEEGFSAAHQGTRWPAISCCRRRGCILCDIASRDGRTLSIRS